MYVNHTFTILCIKSISRENGVSRYKYPFLRALCPVECNTANDTMYMFPDPGDLGECLVHTVHTCLITTKFCLYMYMFVDPWRHERKSWTLLCQALWRAGEVRLSGLLTYPSKILCMHMALNHLRWSNVTSTENVGPGYPIMLSLLL